MNEKLTHIRDLNVRDPFIMPVKAEGKYYLYGMRRNPEAGEIIPAIVAYESMDLIWWREPYPVFEKDKEFWGPLDHWAPEVNFWKDKYYIFCSFRAVGSYRRCQCLVSDSPRGPFKAIINKAVTNEDWHCLDGTLYVDLDGKPWMVFCHEWTQVQDGQMNAVQLSDDLAEAVGDPITLFRGSEAPWKFTKSHGSVGWGRITDGPFTYRAKNGQLLMLWSSFSDTGYTIGYAHSKSGEIHGPWIQHSEPIFSQDGGHGMLFNSFDGKLILTIHSPNIMKQERLLLFEMEDKNGKLLVINELTGNWMPNRYYPDGSAKK